MARILVADDNKDIGMIIVERLKMDGHQVEWVAAGDLAVERLKKNDYDLAILDIFMPGMDGFSVCAVIKKSTDVKKIPVLLTSAYRQEEKNIQQSGADAFLPKPFELSKLSLFVKGLL